MLRNFEIWINWMQSLMSYWLSVAQYQENNSISTQYFLHPKMIETYRRRLVFFLLRIRGKHVHNSNYWDRSLPCGLCVITDIAVLSAPSIFTFISTITVFRHVTCSLPLCHLLRNGAFMWNELPIVRHRPRSRAPRSSSDLNGGCSSICGWCGGIQGGCWGDRRGAASCGGACLCLKKCFPPMLVWCHLAERRRFKTQWPIQRCGP